MWYQVCIVKPQTTHRDIQLHKSKSNAGKHSFWSNDFHMIDKAGFHTKKVHISSTTLYTFLGEYKSGVKIVRQYKSTLGSAKQCRGFQSWIVFIIRKYMICYLRMKESNKNIWNEVTRDELAKLMTSELKKISLAIHILPNTTQQHTKAYLCRINNFNLDNSSNNNVTHLKLFLQQTRLFILLHWKHKKVVLQWHTV